jgi:hypothetical protein
MADENFKDSFDLKQLLLFVICFAGLLCLAPILRWIQLLS